MNEKQKLRQHAETILREKMAALPDSEEGLLSDVMVTMLQELRVHQIELEMQNEELRQTQEKLLISRELYFDLYDLAPIGYLTIDEEGIITQANLTACDLFEITRKEVVGKPISRFIHREDQDVYYIFRKNLKDVSDSIPTDLRLRISEGAFFWARLEAKIVKDSLGNKIIRLMLSDITDRKSAEDKVKSLLREKEIILKEVHHRIKNNMGAVKGILQLHAVSIDEPKAIAALTDASNRVQSMIILYDKLYLATDYNELSVFSYLPTLVGEIIANFPNQNSVKVIKEIEDFVLDAKRVQSIGIIVNEILTNIMKYAFIGKSDGTITIRAILKNKTAVFVVQDNGRGIPEEKLSQNGGGFGMMMIHELTKQINGAIKIERINGTKVTIEFEL